MIRFKKREPLSERYLAWTQVSKSKWKAISRDGDRYLIYRVKGGFYRLSVNGEKKGLAESANAWKTHWQMVAPDRRSAKQKKRDAKRRRKWGKQQRRLSEQRKKIEEQYVKRTAKFVKKDPDYYCSCDKV